MKRIALLFLFFTLTFPAFAQQSVQPVGGVSGGAWSYHYISTASTNSTSVTTSKNTIYSIAVFNSTTTLYYLKFYDKASAPTCNTDTVIYTVMIPFGASNAGGGAVISIPVGMRFLNGISFCITANVADNDNTNAATGVTLDLLGF